MMSMKNKLIINIKEIDEIEYYKEKGIYNYLVPLKDFCVGYDTIDVNNINKIDVNYYLLVNRIMTFKDLEKLRSILNNINLKYLKGVFFEDLGVLEIIKDLDLEKIYFPNHFATNYLSINGFLDKGIDSVVVSNEITKEEVEIILDNVSENVVIPVLGYNQIMYSRRNLITNYNKEYNLNTSLNNKITEQITKKQLPILEQEYGTVIFDENIYNNLELLINTKNVKFYLINSTFLTKEDIISYLNSNSLNNNGFLTRKTIYKIGDINE